VLGEHHQATALQTQQQRQTTSVWDAFQSTKAGGYKSDRTCQHADAMVALWSINRTCCSALTDRHHVATSSTNPPCLSCTPCMA
jgi:hypothetical protein